MRITAGPYGNLWFTEETGNKIRVLVLPPTTSTSGESDGNGDFQCWNGQKGNFNLDNDQCEDGDQNRVSSNNVGDGKDFQSTSISQHHSTFCKDGVTLKMELRTHSAGRDAGRRRLR